MNCWRESSCAKMCYSASLFRLFVGPPEVLIATKAAVVSVFKLVCG